MYERTSQTLSTLVNDLFIKQTDFQTTCNPGQKWLGHLSCITYPPSPLINGGKYRVFPNKKGKRIT